MLERLTNCHIAIVRNYVTFYFDLIIFLTSSIIMAPQHEWTWFFNTALLEHSQIDWYYNYKREGQPFRFYSNLTTFLRSIRWNYAWNVLRCISIANIFVSIFTPRVPLNKKGITRHRKDFTINQTENVVKVSWSIKTCPLSDWKTNKQTKLEFVNIFGIFSSDSTSKR